MEKGGLEESSFVVEKSGKHYLSQVLKVKTTTVVSNVDSMYPSVPWYEWHVTTVGILLKTDNLILIRGKHQTNPS